MPDQLSIEGYAIISEDGMLANDAGVMPDALKIKADHDFFERSLDGADVVVHGRHSHEQQPRSPSRRRLILSDKSPGLAVDPNNDKARLWNPARASFAEALASVGAAGGVVAIIGGTYVFGMFLDRFSAFHLSHVPGVRLPGGRPVFPGVPDRSPEAILALHGLRDDPPSLLDAARGVTLVTWRRPASVTTN